MVVQHWCVNATVINKLTRQGEPHTDADNTVSN